MSVRFAYILVQGDAPWKGHPPDIETEITYTVRQEEQPYVEDQPMDSETAG